MPRSLEFSNLTTPTSSAKGTLAANQGIPACLLAGVGVDLGLPASCSSLKIQGHQQCLAASTRASQVVMVCRRNVREKYGDLMSLVRRTWSSLAQMTIAAIRRWIAPVCDAKVKNVCGIEEEP